jgi:hypothetical protein
VSACGGDSHRLGTGENNSTGKGGTGGGAGSAGAAGASNDPCAGKTFPVCAPACVGQVAGTPCAPGDACSMSNVGDECSCDPSGTWACTVHPPLGTGCNKVCEYGDPGDQKWFATCGDPACQSPDPDDPAIPNCTTEQAGASCDKAGAKCEIPGDSCGASLLCTNEDPTTNGCPISRVRHKDGISYLDDKELGAVRDELLRMKLARWHYKQEPVGARSHLGFLIDDQPASDAVLPNGEQVDLYGYTSMATATIQLQQKQIDKLERELEALKKSVSQRCK